MRGRRKSSFSSPVFACSWRRLLVVYRNVEPVSFEDHSGGHSSAPNIFCNTALFSESFYQRCKDEWMKMQPTSCWSFITFSSCSICWRSRTFSACNTVGSIRSSGPSHSTKCEAVETSTYNASSIRHHPFPLLFTFFIVEHIPLGSPSPSLPSVSTSSPPQHRCVLPVASPFDSSRTGC